MISLKRFFSVMNILIFTSVPLLSQAVTSDPMENYSTFSSWFQRRASYKCDESYLQAKMAEEIPKIIFLGLQAIDDVNHDFVTSKLKAVNKNKLSFTCIEDDNDRTWGALFDPTPFFLSLDSFKFSVTGDMIILPKDIVRNLFLPLNELSAISTQRRTDKTAWFNYSLYDRNLYARNAVVHEYLHFLNFDNYSSGLHNSVTAKKSVVRLDDDLVYACAELSFPTWTLSLKHGVHLESGAFVGFDIGKACLMCAMAQDKGNKRPRLNELRTKGALASCSSYHNLKY